MSNPLRNILVTSALPYGNGSIHIGHLVEYIQTDIWVRFQRLRENDILYVCGDDAHGTPIMLKAQSLGVEPKDFIARSNAEHKTDFAKFGVSFDNFYTTDSEINREISYDIYQRVKTAGLIATREIEQLFDPQAGIFLPDRFIRGTCPNCKSPDQYGDACEVCDKTYDPTDLINPISAITGATPELRKSRHIFFELDKARQQLLDLFEKDFVDPGIRNKLREWFKSGKDGTDGPLKDWDISRDAPFFGFPIPDEPGKYFYNWFDAPIGYLASLANKLDLDVKGVRDYWNNPDLERYHFIGKDITYFHALFWPAMLMNAGLAAPTKLAIHGFLTVNGEKMSKTRGTFINAAVYAKHCDPQWLRYYYATKLVPEPQDLDLSIEDFVNRVNSELVGKLANLISRAAPILTRSLDGKTGVPLADAVPLLAEVRGAAPKIAEYYEGRNFAAATRLICTLADKVNKYVEDQAPWALVKKDAEEARGVLTAALDAGRILTIYLKPVLPDFAKKVENCLAIHPQYWRNIVDAMEPHRIAPFERLVDRIELKQVEAMIEESRESLAPKTSETPAPATTPVATAAPATAPATPAAPVAAPAPPVDENALAPLCNFDQFMAVDLRVGLVVTAEPLEKSDKLMKITLDVGPLGLRTILAGIKNAYTAERLVGRMVIFCANLAPRKMGKFGTSEGMILAAGPGGAEVFVLSPDTGAKPGQRVH